MFELNKIYAVEFFER